MSAKVSASTMATTLLRIILLPARGISVSNDIWEQENLDMASNALDIIFKFADLYQARNDDTMLNEELQHWLHQKERARYDDGWSAISRSSMNLSHGPITKKSKSSARRKDSSPKSDEQLLREHQVKHGIKSQPSLLHKVKLYSIDADIIREDKDRGLDLIQALEMDLMRDKQIDKLLVDRILPCHRVTSKIEEYQTDVDVVFDDIATFHAIISETDRRTQFHSLYQCVFQTVANLKGIGLNQTFYDIYRSLVLQYQNISNVLVICHDLQRFFENTHSIHDQQGFIDDSVVPMMMDFFILLFDRLFVLKMSEFAAVCSVKPKYFPHRLNVFVQNQREWNVNLTLSMGLVIHEFARTVGYMRCPQHYNSGLIQERFDYLITRMNTLSSMFVGVKEDFEIMNLIHQCIKNEKSRSLTICIVSDLINHEMLETLLLYFDEIRYEKYIAQSIGGKSKLRRFRMISALKMNVTKDLYMNGQDVKKKTKQKKKKKK